MLYANVAVLCCVLLLRQPLYSYLIFPLMVVVGAWAPTVSFYQFNWLPPQAIINYYSYLALESTIYFVPSCSVKYSYRLRSKLAMLLCSYKSKCVISNKLKFFDAKHLKPLQDRLVGYQGASCIYACRHAFMHSSIHACYRSLPSSHRTLDSVLSIGDETVNDVHYEGEIVPRMPRKYQSDLRKNTFVLIVSMQFFSPIIYTAPRENFAGFLMIIFSLPSAFHKVVLALSGVIFQYFLPNVLGKIFPYFFTECFRMWK